MRFNHFDSTILGINITGQGSTNAVEGTHLVVLRHLVSQLMRRLSLHLASWRAFKRMPAAMTHAMATCPSYTDRCQQRVVVEARGPVGVC
ncbi:MAG TPA: hypothetical protein VHE81_13450 [Lacipirellulaceae bacterium]|nr:hypothetical protein [Lacipirellulaceae bacterium]